MQVIYLFAMLAVFFMIVAYSVLILNGKNIVDDNEGLTMLGLEFLAIIGVGLFFFSCAILLGNKIGGIPEYAAVFICILLIGIGVIINQTFGNMNLLKDNLNSLKTKGLALFKKLTSTTQN